MKVDIGLFGSKEYYIDKLDVKIALYMEDFDSFVEEMDDVEYEETWENVRISPKWFQNLFMPTTEKSYRRIFNELKKIQEDIGFLFEIKTKILDENNAFMIVDHRFYNWLMSDHKEIEGNKTVCFLARRKE